MARPRYFRRIFTVLLTAAVVPAAVVSAMYTTLAGAALRREANARLSSQAAAFAATVASIADSCVRDLSVLASDPAVAEALSPGGRDDPATATKAFRRVLSAFPRSEGFAEATVASADGSVILSLAEAGPEWDVAAYGSWGVFRALRRSDIAVYPRLAALSDASRGAFTVGMAIRGPDGGLVGYALADVRRSALAAAAASNGLQGGASVVFPAGKIVFDQSDPSREGLYRDEAPRPSPGLATARASGAGQEFIVEAAAPPGLYDGFGRSARSVALVGLASAVAIALALALRSSAAVTEPVLAMARSMKLVEAGDLSIRMEPAGDDELGDLARSFNAMTEELDGLLRREVERQELLREAELRSLAAQMNPHFLHNTLASIKSLAKLGRSGEIAVVVSRLGKLLRAGAERREGLSTVGESLARVRDYLEIEKLRFGDRFSFDIRVDPSVESAPIPPLTLEPLAENALTHGLEKKQGRGSLTVEGRTEARDGGEDIVIAFDDDGPGPGDEAMEALSRRLAAAGAPDGEHGMGLLGTNRRLFLEYGAGYGLSISKGRGFRVELRIPGGSTT